VGYRIRHLKIKALTIFSRWFSAFPFYIQGRMDIDRRSIWYDHAFNKTYGGFFPSDRKTPHKVSLQPHDSVREDMLHLICRSISDRSVDGALAELGVFQGETAKLLHNYFPKRRFFLIDTFDGFHETDVQHESREMGVQTTVDHFSETSESRVLRTINPSTDNLEIIKGYFPDSITPSLSESRFALVHLDADLYNPTKAGLAFFYPRLNPGGILVIHDFNAWPGVRKAVLEYCESEKLIPLPMPDKSGSCVIIKPIG